VHIEKDRRTAAELGIPMPTPTIKPLIVAAGIIIMFSGLLFIHRPSKAIAFTLIFSGASILVGTLYAWLLTPLEPEHH
jgi:cytochrome c oxidase subunit 1